MNTTHPETRPRSQAFAGGLPEFLAALERIYRCLGLAPHAARAATFADAEIFVPESELAA